MEFHIEDIQAVAEKFLDQRIQRYPEITYHLIEAGKKKFIIRQGETLSLRDGEYLLRTLRPLEGAAPVGPKLFFKTEPTPTEDKIKAAVAKKGTLTPEQRSEIARKAVATRKANLLKK